MEQIYDMIVIGGGPAGYTAALYAARSGLSTLVLEKLSAGGQMALTEQIDNYPGFEDGIDGFTLGEKMQQSAERFGAVTELAEVYKVSLSGGSRRWTPARASFRAARWSSPPARRPAPWAFPARIRSRERAFTIAPPATARPIGARPWRWWAAATLPRRTHLLCPASQKRSTSSTAATACGQRRSIMSR